MKSFSASVRGEHVVLKQALGISITEEVSLVGASAGGSSALLNGQAAHWVASGKESAEGAAFDALQKSLRLHGLQSLHLLNHANGATTCSEGQSLIIPSHFCTCWTALGHKSILQSHVQLDLKVSLRHRFSFRGLPDV